MYSYFYRYGFKPPKYAHVSYIMKEEGEGKRKLSKRKDPEAAVSYFHENGIPSEVVTEYIMNIANSNFEEWRRQNPLAHVLEFELRLNKMSQSGALFDMIKLLDISKEYISKLTKEEIYNKTLEWAERYNIGLAELLKKDENYAKEIFGIERGNKKPRKDFAKWSDIEENIIYMYDEKFDPDEYIFQNITDKEEIKNILDTYINEYYEENDDKDAWFNKIKEVSGKFGYAKEVKQYKQEPEKYKGHVGDVSMVLRIALTARQNTPDMYEIMKLFGKQRIEKRFEKCKQNYSK